MIRAAAPAPAAMTVRRRGAGGSAFSDVLIDVMAPRPGKRLLPRTAH
ncbi:hypothetical protein [Streptomyces sp. MAI_2237]